MNSQNKPRGKIEKNTEVVEKHKEKQSIPIKFNIQTRKKELGEYYTDIVGYTKNHQITEKTLGEMEDYKYFTMRDNLLSIDTISNSPENVRRILDFLKRKWRKITFLGERRFKDFETEYKKKSEKKRLENTKNYCYDYNFSDFIIEKIENNEFLKENSQSPSITSF